MDGRFFTRGAAAAFLAGAASLASAGTVNLTGWGHDSAANVGLRQATVTNTAPGNPTFGPKTVYAGAFRGTVSGFTGADSWVNSALANDFLTYCVEFTESFTLPSSMSGYALVGGSGYTHWGSNALQIAGRLGSLLTYVGGLTGESAISTVKESAAVQLAVWETIYETPVGVDLDLTNGNLVETRGSTINTEIRSIANSLLAGSAQTSSIYEVFVLTKSGSQDFIALREGGSPQLDVPEPASLALVAVALGAAGIASRRRKPQA